MGRSSWRNFERYLQEDFASTASAVAPIPPTSHLQTVERVVFFLQTNLFKCIYMWSGQVGEASLASSTHCYSLR